MVEQGHEGVGIATADLHTERRLSQVIPTAKSALDCLGTVEMEVRIPKPNPSQCYLSKFISDHSGVIFMNKPSASLLDIGGSGVKVFMSENLPYDIRRNDIEASHYPPPDWDNFIDWLKSIGVLESELIGISCAGFIDNAGSIKRSKVTGWRDRPLAREIETLSPQSRVFLLNDAEAHLAAHVDLFANPVMCISLGTSVGFAISDNNGKITRPSDGINFDIGMLRIPTNASEKRVWAALGSHGLNELIEQLGEEEGVKRFGYRLGGFLADIWSLFRPKTIVLSGGITRKRWDGFYPSLVDEFHHANPGIVWATDVRKSPFSRNAALLGMGKHIVSLST